MDGEEGLAGGWLITCLSDFTQSSFSVRFSGTGMSGKILLGVCKAKANSPVLMDSSMENPSENDPSIISPSGWGSCEIFYSMLEQRFSFNPYQHIFVIRQSVVF